MGDIIKLAVTLTVISAIAGLAIGAVNGRTKDRIAAQQIAARQAAIAAVFPEGAAIREMKDKGAGAVPDLYWVGFDGDSIVGYAFEISGSGYAGSVKFMAGVGVDGKILGLTVLDHNETPGLGSRVNEAPSSKYIWYPVGGDGKAKPWFTEQFEGLSALKSIGIDKNAEWHKLDESARTALRDRNAVTAITGSTITTMAFTRSIEEKIAAYIRELGGYCCIEAKITREKEVAATVVDTNVSIDSTDIP